MIEAAHEYFDFKRNQSYPCANTDVELWRAAPGDYYSPSIRVTISGESA